jgi:hypothetical protein
LETKKREREIKGDKKEKKLIRKLLLKRNESG